MKIFTALLLSGAGYMEKSWAFVAPGSMISQGPMLMHSEPSPSLPLRSARLSQEVDGHPNRRRDFLKSISSMFSIVLFPTITQAGDEYLYRRDGEGQGDLTSQLFNPDGSLRDPNMVVEAQEKAISLPFSMPSSVEAIDVQIATDGAQPTSDAGGSNNLIASYKLPLKWNQDATSKLPLYYDSSEGKNGKSCNRMTVYSISAPNSLDMSTLEKASRIGVAKSIFMDQVPNRYFDKGVMKADLIGGRTVRKPIKSADAEGEYDEQTYYEFDLAFAPESCPDFREGNRENLGLGFCPYDNIFLVSATVLRESERGKGGTLMVCVVECNKDEWKLGNSDLKRVRSSFAVERA
ncbi:hypothetical protein ACHAWF_016754 [Thalassiosira exigua]